jgi:hypothetical protein
VAALRADSGEITYCGVGNISGTVLTDGTSRKTVSLAGTLGHALAKTREFSYPMPPGAVFIMHSDGLLTSWNLDGYQGLLARHPSLIAGVMYRDFLRGRDDATVLVVRRAA